MTQGAVDPFERVAFRAMVLVGGVVTHGSDADVVSCPRLVRRAVGGEEVAILAQRLDQDVRASALTPCIDEAVDSPHRPSLPVTPGVPSGGARTGGRTARR